MPAFIVNGPDIPESLLEAHEEGRIVFFCGAGISYPAGLPGFKGLVDKIYENLGAKHTSTEQQAYKNEQYDITLGLLERRYPGQRIKVRKELATVLTPSLKDDSTITHKSLIRLATSRDGKVRLVTTNFDRLFQYVITKDRKGIPIYPAPFLPIPKKSRWDGIVYLHGLLPESDDEAGLNRLVLTSGDFGLAYLTERWASRFVTELFRHYIVCFVGYSINDRVLRYMMDALAADELLGETRPEVFAFASYNNEEREQAKIEWKAKGVTPLLYEAPKDSNGKSNHSALHKTLKEWADTYRDGVQGKEMIISQHASTPPLTPSRTDYAVGRVLWALTDELAVKHFADLNPVPPLEWLEPLSEKQFEHRDLSRFGVVANSTEDKYLRFSIFHRPAPYTHSPWMCIVNDGTQNGRPDPVMFHLFRWLTRHLNDPKLILWLAKYGDRLHESFVHQIRNRLDELDRLAANGEEDEIKRIIGDAPHAIPGLPMRTLWRLFVTGRIRSQHLDDVNLYRCVDRIKREGLTPSLRMELCENLAPRVALGAPFHLIENTHTLSESMRIKDLVNWELVLQSNDVNSLIDDWSKSQNYQEVLPDLLQDFTLLLRDALDLVRELGDANDRRDSSCIEQPSISDHPQNSNFYDWTALIRLARDAWLATAQIDSEKARYAAEGWWQQSYPVFKRLALFAASHDEVISHRQALDWLLGDNCWWLWSVETQREAMRLLAALAPKIVSSEVFELEQAILFGPPREMFKEDLEDKEWEHIVNRMVWLSLAKFQAAGGKLGELANTKVDKLSQEHPNWKLTEDERDEFPFWMGEGDERQKISCTPQDCTELVEWLKKHETPDHWEGDDWHQRCRDDFTTTSCALRVLAEEDKWLDGRWKQALIAWSEDTIKNESWSNMGSFLNTAPNEIIQSIAHELSWWLRAVAKTFVNHEEIFLNLCHRILEQNYPDEDNSDDPVTQAINQPVGIVTDAMLQWWYRKLKDDKLLSEELKTTFTEICNIQIGKFQHGRVLLAAHVITLYRVDPIWTKKYLLTLFDWSSSAEARMVWEGFLWSPRLYRPLMVDIKEPFLKGAKHYRELGKHAGQFAAFLTFISLDPGDIFSTDELADATGHLPVEGLERVVQTLITALEGARDQRGEYLHNRLFPYLHDIWPKDRSLITSTISRNFALLCLAADEFFPEALEELKYLINSLQNPGILFSRMHKGEICTKFPEEALSFLDLVVVDSPPWLSRDLHKCLNDIAQSNEQLTSDSRFVRLNDLAKKYG
ncbi:hypothetical protein MSSIH_1122 [Methanosarcina siciliae HI350]|uniref:Uncharacterized protein n=1 Tax=Methanosarcina siciliae HI350 TaxID=1434119 RepID=A0A0E3PC24_9EURY|nr:anti-phage defense-associated sirtuin Dsr1 [Methanosarcina siciliae]AKB31812.1 hypothetical protein MSSIH_1122 [Methanosarcina siciliae HI350]